jgi:hypothetical protein
MNLFRVATADWEAVQVRNELRGIVGSRPVSQVVNLDLDKVIGLEISLNEGHLG